MNKKIDCIRDGRGDIIHKQDMQSRLLKQFIYGVLYVGMISGVGYLVFIGFFQSAPSCFDNRQNQNEEGVDCGGSCVACEIKSLKNINVLPVHIFPLGDGTISALLEFRNPNINYGADSLSYSILFYDATNNVVATTTRDSFIYPGEIKFIVEPALQINASSVVGARAEVEVRSWKKIDTFSLPRLITQNLTVQETPQKNFAIISGIIVNQNTFSLSRVTLHGVLNDENGIPHAISKTVVENMMPLEARQFQINTPLVGVSFSPSQNGIKVYSEAER